MGEGVIGEEEGISGRRRGKNSKEGTEEQERTSLTTPSPAPSRRQ
jgi:hypothetical protein